MTVKGSEIRFGVEVECYVPVGTRGIPTGQYHHGLQIRKAPRGWNGQSDSSLDTGITIEGQRYKAVEVVSPILAGLNGLAQVWYVLELLESVQAITTHQCGIHIHVEGLGINSDNVGALKNAFRLFEDVFMGLNGEKIVLRRHNVYCKTSDKWSRATDYTDKYRTMNLKNLRNASKRTVEFRLFAGEIDSEFIVTAAYMCIALVVGVVNGERVKRDHLRNRREMIWSRKAWLFIEKYWGKSENLMIEDEPIDDVKDFLFGKLDRAYL